MACEESLQANTEVQEMKEALKDAGTKVLTKFLAKMVGNEA